LGGRKGIRPVKTEWWGAGVVICLEQGADLHMAQLMPLTVSCFSKIQVGFTFLVPLTQVVREKGPLNGCVCVCVTFRHATKIEIRSYLNISPHLKYVATLPCETSMVKKSPCSSKLALKKLLKYLSGKISII